MRHKRLPLEGSVPSGSTQSAQPRHSFTSPAWKPKVCPLEWNDKDWPKSQKTLALGPAPMPTVEARSTNTHPCTGLVFPGVMRACTDGLLPFPALTFQNPVTHRW